MQQSAVQAVETLERAKKHCEDWFVYQGEQLENIFFKHIASGGQSDVYKCESLRFCLSKFYRMSFNNNIKREL